MKSQTSEMNSEQMKNLDRFWLVYLPCLEKPRSLKEISELFGLVNKSGQPLSHLYQEKLTSNMRKVGAIEVDIPSLGKEHKFISKLDFLDYTNQISEFLSKDWVRKELLSTEKLLKLYENDLNLIKRRGREFIPLVLSILSSFCASVKLSDNMKNKYPPSMKRGKKELDAQRKSLLPFLFHSLYPDLKVKNYLIQIFDSLLIHEQEIIEFIENISK